MYRLLQVSGPSVRLSYRNYFAIVHDNVEMSNTLQYQLGRIQSIEESSLCKL